MAVRGGWSRRAVLSALGTVATLGATGAVAGCSWFEDPPPPPDPLEPLLAGARELAARYEQALTAHPHLADLLRPIQRAHLAHVDALVDLIGRPELATAAPAAATGPGSPTAAAATPHPEAEAEAEELLAELRRVEATGQAEAAEACLSAPAGRTALLGAIAAARATHAEVL